MPKRPKGIYKINTGHQHDVDDGYFYFIRLDFVNE